MSKYLYLICILSFLILAGSHCTTTQKTSITQTIEAPATSAITNTTTPVQEEYKPLQYIPPPKDSLQEITINLVGDLMCHKPQTTNAEVKPGVHDFRPSFEYIKPYLQDADITIGNLETTFAGPNKPYAGYPAFNSPDAYCAALKDAGFDFLVTSNNHSMDTQEDGLLRTIDVIKKNNLGYTGTYLSQRDHDSIRILNIKGVKLAILNYTYGTNGAYPSTQRKYMLNLIDSTEITNAVKLAKLEGAEMILVFYHFGLENIQEPTQAQKDAVKYALEAGAQLVIGAHPHVLGPTQVGYSKAINDTAFVAYSLGNFISNQYWRYTDAGVVLKLTVEKNITKNTCRYKSANYLPTWVYRGDGSRKMHIVLPAQLVQDSTKLPAFINASHKQKMEEAFQDTKQILTKNNPSLILNSVK